MLIFDSVVAPLFFSVTVLVTLVYSGWLGDASCGNESACLITGYLAS